MRICSRGHINPRGVTFCSECGSADLSTPAPPASWLYRLSGFALYGFALATVVLVAGIATLAVLRSIDWDVVAGRLVLLLLMLGLLYWTTTLLPGPIRRIGTAAGRKLLGLGGREKRH